MATVLYLNLYGTVGGAERALLELVAGLDRSRHQPLVVLGADGPLAAALCSRGVETLVLPFPTPPLSRLFLPWVLARELAASVRVLRLSSARGVRRVHCGDVLALLLLLPARVTGVRVLYQLHYLGSGIRLALLNLLALLAVDRIVAYSADQRAALQRRTFGLGSRTTVVHPGLAAADFAGGQRARVRQELGLEGRVVGMVARFDTWKGHATFLDAAARIRCTRPDVHFVIAGGALNRDQLPHVARYEADVVRMIDALDLRDHVSVLGHRDDVPDVLAALDVLVCPSQREPFGMVVLEAWAAGTPVVASDSGGPAEIIEDGRSGLLFPTGDGQALAERVERMLDGATLRDRLSEGGRRRVREVFSRERYVRDIEALYDCLA